MTTLLKCSCLIGVLALLAVVDVDGQTFQGGLRGAVADAQGLIPGATVALTNEQTNITRDAVTNDSGAYSFAALDPGSYSVRVAVPGFKTFERKGLRINTQQFVTLDIVLEVGVLEETITVLAQAPLIETSNASTGNVLDSDTLQALPSTGRNIFLISNTVPTVVRSGNGLSNRMQDQSDASLLSLGGGGVRANNYILDGVPIIDLTNRPISNPTIEAVQDLKVQVHTYDAEMGRTGGGVFNTTARSGANAFQGSGFFQTRPGALVSQNFFLKLQGVPKDDQYWRNGGGGFGGPLRRNRTFFWTAGEVYREAATRNGNLHFPSTAMRAGDFSALTDAGGMPVVIYDPLTTRLDPVTGAQTRDPFPGNRIPADRINPVGAKILSYFPLPDVDRDNGQPNAARSALALPGGEQGTVKISHNFNKAITLSGLYLRQTTRSPLENYFTESPFAGPSYLIDRLTHVATLNNTYVVNSTTVLALRYGWTRFDDDRALPYDFDARTLGFNPAFGNAIQVQKFPQINLTGYSGTGFTGLNDTSYYSRSANGTLTKLLGSHSLKFGGDYGVLGVRAMDFGQSAGTFGFTSTFTQGPNPLSPSRSSGNPVADLLLGYPANGTIPITRPIDAYTTYFGAYVQDDYRVSSRFTLNYGLRLEHESGLKEKNDNFTVGFDRDAVSPLARAVAIAGRDAIRGGLVFAGVDGAPSHQGNPPAIKASPRVGAVFSINDATVIRGGYGLFWAPWNYPGPGTTNYGQFGYSATTTLQQNTLVPITSIDNPFPGGLTQPSENSLGLLTGVGGNISFVDPEKTATRVQQYSADIQRELPGDMNVSLGYVGSRGNNLGYGGTTDTGININQLDPQYQSLGTQLVQLVPNPFFGVADAGGLGSRATIERGQLLRPYPQFLNVLMTQSTAARSRYNAIVLQLNKRASTDWWGGQFSYTWSRLDDNQFGQSNFYAPNSAAGRLLDNYDPGSDFGRSLLDSPVKVVLAPIIRPPFGRGQRFLNSGGPLEYLVGGWSIAAVAMFQSGFPISVGQANNNSGLFGSGQRPNVVPNVDRLVGGDIRDRLRANVNDNQYLNPAAWSLAPAYTFGNAPRVDASIRTPSRNQLDLAFSKDFPTGGRTSAQLRIEVINVMDNPWFTSFSTDVGAANFGQITTQGNYPRVAQITFRLKW
jgi:trimeric autotransporter adhesin